MDGSLGAPRSPYWLIVCGSDRGPYGLEVLTLHSSGREKALPLFGREEDATAFLRALAAEGEEDKEWRARETWGGELLSVLSASGVSAGPCADVEKIALDPPTEMANGFRAELGLVSMGRRCFMERLMGRGRAWFDGTRGG